MISQKARYALKALIALSRADAPRSLQARDIALGEQVPRSFLEQIMLELKRGGIVGSRRGREGGYYLAKSPESVTLGEVLRLVDGPVAPLPCLSRTAYRRCEDCTDEANCAVRAVFRRAYETNADILDTTTLADAIAGSASGTPIDNVLAIPAE